MSFAKRGVFMCTKRVSAFLLVLLLLSVSMTALADANISVTWVPITSSPFVVDSLHGVDAIYYTNQKLYCYEFVQRYYKQIYGISISTGYGGPQTYSSNYRFEQTANPKPGDVVYSPSYLRAAGYAHWMLVKDYKDGVVTLIEQNWKWSGKAALDRKISIDHSECFFYTLVGKDPIADINIAPKKVIDPTAPSTWAEKYLEKAENNGIYCAGAYRDNITRAEFCALILQAAQVLKPNLEPLYSPYNFTDTDDANVILCCQLGFVTGTSDTTFSPYAPITREAAATMIHRMLLSVSEDVPKSAKTDDSLKNVSSWARDSFAVLSSLKIMTGVNGDLMPKDYLTNEQALVIIVRILED